MIKRLHELNNIKKILKKRREKESVEDLTAFSSFSLYLKRTGHKERRERGGEGEREGERTNGVVDKWRIPKHEWARFKEHVEVRVSLSYNFQQATSNIGWLRKKQSERVTREEWASEVFLEREKNKKNIQMGRSTSCLKIITCGSDSADRDDLQLPEVPDWSTIITSLVFLLLTFYFQSPLLLFFPELVDFWVWVVVY